MGIVHGAGTAYAIDGQGKVVWPSEAKISLNDRDILAYDAKTGILALDMNEGDLEKMLKSLGQIPPEGVDIALPVPPFGDEQQFHGVRRLEKIKQDGQPMFGTLIEQHQNPWKSAYQKFMNYFRS